MYHLDAKKIVRTLSIRKLTYVNNDGNVRIRT